MAAELHQVSRMNDTECVVNGLAMPCAAAVLVLQAGAGSAQTVDCPARITEISSRTGVVGVCLVTARACPCLHGLAAPGCDQSMQDAPVRRACG